MKKNIDVSIIILNYNTLELTRVCLQTIFASEIKPYTQEIIVCDNGSTDGSLSTLQKEFPRVLFVDNKKNIGFAAGNNRGIEKATGRYILLLNSDVEVQKNTISYMIAFMDKHTDVGAASCALMLPNGKLDPASHRGFPTPWVAFTYMTKLEKLFPKSTLFGGHHLGYKDKSTPHEVDSISGAFFLVRKEVVNKVGMLDEDYFMYGEDEDWAYKIKQTGWKIMFVPDVTALHKKKQSGRGHADPSTRKKTERYFHENNWLFYKKNYAKKYGPILSGIVALFYKTKLYFLK